MKGGVRAGGLVEWSIEKRSGCMWCTSCMSHYWSDAFGFVKWITASSKEAGAIKPRMIELSPRREMLLGSLATTDIP